MSRRVGTQHAATPNKTVGTQLAASALQNRKSTRLPGYDYSAPGAYFVTICSHDRGPMFGNVIDGIMHLNPLGALVQRHLVALSTHYSNLKLDPAFVVMPNHAHLIPTVLDHNAFPDLAANPAKGLNYVVRSFKAGVTKEAREAGLFTGSSLWLGRFYEHVIRHQKALESIQDYIVNNPLQWHLDRENPERLGISEFYKWIESYSAKVRALQHAKTDAASCVPTVPRDREA